MTLNVPGHRSTDRCVFSNGVAPETEFVKLELHWLGAARLRVESPEVLSLEFQNDPAGDLQQVLGGDWPPPRVRPPHRLVVTGSHFGFQWKCSCSVWDGIERSSERMSGDEVMPKPFGLHAAGSHVAGSGVFACSFFGQALRNPPPLFLCIFICCASYSVYLNRCYCSRQTCRSCRD